MIYERRENDIVDGVKRKISFVNNLISNLICKVLGSRDNNYNQIVIIAPY